MSDAEVVELAAWVGAAVGVPVTLERAVVRREGWIATDGDTRWFLRLGRAEDPANPPEGVVLEGRLTHLLGEHGLAVAGVVAIRDDGAVLYSWVDGHQFVENEPVERHDDLLGAYMDQLALLHTLAPAAAGIDWMHRPVDAREAALAHAEAIWDQMGHLALEPLGTFGMVWLRRHVPEHIDRLSVLHGDAGTGNYLVDETGMTGVIDWEWAHLGDPMEDLGSAVMHASFHPAGDLPTALARYEAASGIPVDLAKVRYYAAHLYIRSVVALSAHVAHLDPHNPVALNLAYKLVNDRLTCEAIADALGVTLTRPDLPSDEAGPTTMFDVVRTNLVEDVAPATTTGFARDRAEMAAVLVGMLARQARFGATISRTECEELAVLLGHEVTDYESGLRALDALMTTAGPEREVELLGYLYRRAVRAEWLSGPVAALFPDRVIGAL